MPEPFLPKIRLEVRVGFLMTNPGVFIGKNRRKIKRIKTKDDFDWYFCLTLLIEMI